MPVETPNVQTLRAIFRGLHLFRSAYESDGITEITDEYNHVWTIWDVEYLYDIAVTRAYLPRRQRQAIELFLVKNLPEDEVARLLAIKSTNPTGMYATSGLKSLIMMMDDGKIRNPYRGEL